MKNAVLLTALFSSACTGIGVYLFMDEMLIQAKHDKKLAEQALIAEMEKPPRVRCPKQREEYRWIILTQGM